MPVPAPNKIQGTIKDLMLIRFFQNRLLYGAMATFVVLCGFFWGGLLTVKAAVLDGFEIKTIDDQHVQVILHTDQRAAVESQHTASGFKLVLKDTALSSRNLGQGLPVVIDNKNRFIGRAIPDDDGQTRILIPNLNPDEVTVSIIQQPLQQGLGRSVKGQTAGPLSVSAQKTPSKPSVFIPPERPKTTIQSAVKLKPRLANSSAVSNPLTSQFSSLAASLSKPSQSKTLTPVIVGETSQLKAQNQAQAKSKAQKPKLVPQQPIPQPGVPQLTQRLKPTLLSAKPFDDRNPVNSSSGQWKLVAAPLLATPTTPPATERVVQQDQSLQDSWLSFGPEASGRNATLKLAAPRGIMPFKPPITQQLESPGSLVGPNDNRPGDVDFKVPTDGSLNFVGAAKPSEHLKPVGVTNSDWLNTTPLWILITGGLLLLGLILFLLVGVLLMVKLLFSPSPNPIPMVHQEFRPLAVPVHSAPLSQSPSSSPVSAKPSIAEEDDWLLGAQPLKTMVKPISKPSDAKKSYAEKPSLGKLPQKPTVSPLPQTSFRESVRPYPGFSSPGFSAQPSSEPWFSEGTVQSVPSGSHLAWADECGDLQQQETGLEEALEASVTKGLMLKFMDRTAQ